MATYATQAIAPSGLEATYQAVAATDKCRPGPGVFLHVKNGGDGNCTVVVDDPTSVGPTGSTAFNPDTTIVITAGEERFIGPITDRFAAASDGLAVITYSPTTSVTAAAIQI